MSLSLSLSMSLESLESLICWYRIRLVLGFLRFGLSSSFPTACVLVLFASLWPFSLLSLLPSSVGVLFRLRVCHVSFPRCSVVSVCLYLVFLVCFSTWGCSFRFLSSVVSFPCVVFVCGLACLY